jgi:hypothetical protein
MLSFVEIKPGGRIFSEAQRFELDPAALFRFIAEEYGLSADSRFISIDHDVYGPIVRRFGYSRPEAAAFCDALKASLTEASPSIRSLLASLKVALKGIEIVYLPTYRRIELPLSRKDTRDQPSRRRKPFRVTGNLGSRVYFFIDRDFDDLAGRDADDGTTFMIDRYSVENYLVSADVLEELLKDEFHCHAEPRVREEIIRVFESRFNEFLAATKEINLRLFIARQLKLELKKNIPEGVNHLAVVELTRVTPVQAAADSIIVYDEKPEPADLDRLTRAFEAFNPADRYRGKFCHVFFMKWLDLLSEDRRQDRSRHFYALARPRMVRMQSISLGMLASKSQLPHGLSEFIATVQ